MRIAYVAPYQGPTLVNRRPIVRNRSMSNRVKIELIDQRVIAVRIVRPAVTKPLAVGCAAQDNHAFKLAFQGIGDGLQGIATDQAEILHDSGY